MTSINELRGIVETTRSLSNREMKESYLKQQNRGVLNFLSGNIKKDGIAKAIASEIPLSTLTFSISSIEDIVTIFKNASNRSRRKDKIESMHSIKLSPKDRDLVLTILYGSLKLGLKIPVPEPKFGEVIKPMLCGTGIEFNPSEMIIEHKWDGIRCIATNNNGKITLQSRNGKVLNVPVIERSLINILPSGTTVDGEIVAPNGDFQSLNRKSDKLIYMIFDILYYREDPILIYSLSYRKDFIKKYIIENNYVKISQSLNLNTIKEIDNWINESKAEGIVAKDPNSLYQYGNRKDWIKRKPFLDISGDVIGYTEGTGKRKGILGAVEFLPDGFKETTFVGSGFTNDQLIEMKELIDNNNKIRIDVKYQNITSDNRSLRFPIFLRIREINGEEI